MSNRGRAGVHQQQGRPSSAGGSAAESRKTMPTDANTTPTNNAQQVDSASTQQQSGGDTTGAMWGGSNEGDGADTAGDAGIRSDRERAAPTRSASWLESRAADKVESDRGKRPRVEGRGSSAAQRAAANEACKGITLEALQAQYYRPLSDVAKDLGVSVARLLKKCREFGILRWPYRHVRSVQESIEQLEKDRAAATDDVATDELELRLKLLRRRGELVVHFASCGLESDMRKGIFLADPRDVDTMLATANEVHGGRKIPPPGWDSLGRFPDPAVRENFLQQMRSHMVGGSAMLSPPDSPHTATNVHDDSASSLEDSSRDSSHQPKLHQHQQPYLGFRGSMAQHTRPEGQWHQPPPQSHSYSRQASHQYQQPAWQQGHSMYSRPGSSDQGHPPLQPLYWPGAQGGAEMPESIMGSSSAGVLGVGDFGRMRSPGRAVEISASAPGSHAAVYPPPTTVAPPMSAGLSLHHEEGARNSSLSPLLRPMSGGGGGSSSYRSMMRSPESGRGDVDLREAHVPMGAWGAGPLGLTGEAATSTANHGCGGSSSVPREVWRPTERMTPPTSSHRGGPARRAPWVAGDLPNPSGRSGVPPGGAGVLPSIFDRYGGLERPQSAVMSGVAESGATSTVAAAVSTTSELRQTYSAATEAVGVSRDVPGWTRAFQEPPIGTYGHRWGAGTVPSPQQQQQQHPSQMRALGSPVTAPRWQDRPTSETGESTSVGPSITSDPVGSGSRGNPPWASGPRAGSVDEGKEKGSFRGSWAQDSLLQERRHQQLQHQPQHHNQQERVEPPRSNPEQTTSHGPYF